MNVPINRKIWGLLALWTALLAPAVGQVNQQQFYISPTGNDRHAGDSIHPLRSIEQARRLARPYYGKQPIEFVFADGTHYLTHSIDITPAESGTAACPVRYRAMHEGQAVLSGGQPLRLHWKRWKGNIQRAKVPQTVEHIDQLYVNGRRKSMARYPNRNGKNVFDAWDLSHEARPDSAADLFNPRRIRSWQQPQGAYIHAMHSSLWGDMHWLVTGRDSLGQLCYEGGWQNNRPSKMHPVYRMIEHVFEELDEAGEWYFDAQQQWLYYYPEPNETMKQASVEVVCLPELIRLRGTRTDTVAHTHLEGLVFRHTARTFMENKEPLLRSDWTICRKAAVTYEGATDCRLHHCEFDQVGGNAVMVSGYNRRLHFYGCYLHEGGSNGFSFVGDPSSVRSPLFRYGSQQYDAIDRRPGPQNDLYPADCQVEECLITRTGRVEKQTAPVQISMAYGITVSHCSIYDVPRAGINISEGTFGGHVIRYCDIFNTVLETGDHGSFNSWGRDRYWSPGIGTTSQQVARDTTLTWLDMLAPNTLHDNRWRCDHGWDVDLDDGSSHYRIYNNVLLGGGLKLREGYDRLVTNNVIVNNSLHPHVWYPHSGDVFCRNIVFRAYLPIGMNVCMSDTAHWGKEIDYNWFVSADSERERYAANGCDGHSQAGDPLFRNVSQGDFGLQATSPALALGIRSLPATTYGVTLPRLRRLARTPEIPEVVIDTQRTSPDKRIITWQGARIKGVETLGEQSATGLKDRNGALVIAVEKTSVLYRCGLRTNDVILKWGDTLIHTPAELLRAVAGATSHQRYLLTIWRNQEPMQLEVTLEGAQ